MKSRVPLLRDQRSLFSFRLRKIFLASNKLHTLYFESAHICWVVSFTCDLVWFIEYSMYFAPEPGGAVEKVSRRTGPQNIPTEVTKQIAVECAYIFLFSKWLHARPILFKIVGPSSCPLNKACCCVYSSDAIDIVLVLYSNVKSQVRHSLIYSAFNTRKIKCSRLREYASIPSSKCIKGKKLRFNDTLLRNLQKTLRTAPSAPDQ